MQKMPCSCLSPCRNLGRPLTGLTVLPHMPHRKKRLKVHSTSPHVRKGFQGERGVGKSLTWSSAPVVEIVPWDIVWTKTVWVLVLLHYEQVKRMPAPQKWANPHLQSQQRHYLEDFWHGAPFTLGMDGIMKRTHQCLLTTTDLPCLTPHKLTRL